MRHKAIGDPSESQLIGFARQVLRPKSVDPNQLAGLSQPPKKWVAYPMTVVGKEVQMVMDVSAKSMLLVDINGNGLL